MRDLRRRISLTVLVLTLWAGALLAPQACNTQGCTENHSAVPKAQFCSMTDGRAISLDSVQISGVGAPGDSVLYEAGTSRNSVYLPMRSAQSRTQWCLSYKWKYLDNPALNDTLTFDYQALPYLAGDECGAMYRYKVTGVRYTAHLIDSVGVTDSLITNIDRVYFNIYFRTTEGGEQ